MLTQDQLEQLGVDVSAPAPAPAASANPDGALAYGVDQAQRLTGRGVQAIGGALRQAGADGVGGWIEGAGRGIVEQQDRDIEAGGFKPQYPGGFLDQPGIGAKLGWLGEGIATNAASSIPALAGAAGAAVLAPTAPALAAGALALGGGTPKGTIVQVHDNPPSQHLYCCVIPGYPQDCYIRPIYLEFLDETGEA